MPFVFSNTWFGGSRKTANYKGLFAKIKLVEAARKGEGGRERESKKCQGSFPQVQGKQKTERRKHI